VISSGATPARKIPECKRPHRTPKRSKGQLRLRRPGPSKTPKAENLARIAKLAISTVSQPGLPIPKGGTRTGQGRPLLRGHAPADRAAASIQGEPVFQPRWRGRPPAPPSAAPARPADARADRAVISHQRGLQRHTEPKGGGGPSLAKKTAQQARANPDRLQRPEHAATSAWDWRAAGPAEARGPWGPDRPTSSHNAAIA